MAKGKKEAPTFEALQAEAKAARERLGRSSSELAFRTSPPEVKRRATDAAQSVVMGVVQTPEGQWRYDRFAAALGGVAGVALLLGGLRMAFYKR